MDAKRHAQPSVRPCASFAGHVVPLMKFGRFHQNEQVRVVTRSFVPLSQDGNIIAQFDWGFAERRGAAICD